jgi:hypothetical protein
MITPKKAFLVAIVFAAVVITAFICYPRRKTNSYVHGKNPSASASPVTSLNVYSGKVTAGDVASRIAGAHWQNVGGLRERLEKAVATSDQKKWDPVIGELLNPNYRRGDAIKILVDFLSHPDWSVRIRSAQELLEIGSRDGLETLRLALRNAGESSSMSPVMVDTAAHALHRSGEKIDALDLQRAYSNYPRPELLEIAALQGASWVPDVVRQKRSARDSLIPTELIAAYVAMKDPDSIQRYNLLLTLNPTAKVVGNWALYRATNDESRLQYLIEVLQEGDGTIPKTENSEGDATMLAAKFVSMTESASVTRYLESVVNRGTSIGRMRIESALGSLYLVQKDYAFVDEKVLSYFTGRWSAPTSASSLLWEIAATRRTPELEQLALAKNPTAFDQNFVQMDGRMRSLRPLLLAEFANNR